MRHFDDRLLPEVSACRGAVIKLFNGELSLEYPPADAEQLEQLILLQEKLRLTEIHGEVRISKDYEATHETASTFLAKVINIGQKKNNSSEADDFRPDEIHLWCHLKLIGNECKWWKIKRLFAFYKQNGVAVFSRDKISWDLVTREINLLHSYAPRLRVATG